MTSSFGNRSSGRFTLAHRNKTELPDHIVGTRPAGAAVLIYAARRNIDVLDRIERDSRRV